MPTMSAPIWPPCSFPNLNFLLNYPQCLPLPFLPNFPNMNINNNLFPNNQKLLEMPKSADFSTFKPNTIVSPDTTMKNSSKIDNLPSKKPKKSSGIKRKNLSDDSTVSSTTNLEICQKSHSVKSLIADHVLEEKKSIIFTAGNERSKIPNDFLNAPFFAKNFSAEKSQSKSNDNFHQQQHLSPRFLDNLSEKLENSPKSSAEQASIGFQDGVTIGYTYDALFVTDGRSKRRRNNSGSCTNNSGSRCSFLELRYVYKLYCCTQRQNFHYIKRKLHDFS